MRKIQVKPSISYPPRMMTTFYGILARMHELERTKAAKRYLNDPMARITRMMMTMMMMTTTMTVPIKDNNNEQCQQ